MSSYNNQMAQDRRDRVMRLVRDHFSDEDIAKIDRAMGSAGVGAAMALDRGRSPITHAPMDFNSRFPDAARIKIWDRQ